MEVPIFEAPLVSEPAVNPVTAPDLKPRSKAFSLRNWIHERAMRGWSTQDQNPGYFDRTAPFWDFLRDRYFRVSTRGWERLPEGACMVIGVHAGTWLTMDAWMLVYDWWKHFRGQRVLHGTAHDVLMALPGLGTLFRNVGVIPSSRATVSACLGAGHCVVIWPGGEVDAMRSWGKRNKVVLDDRRGFVRQAIRSGVPIVPVASVGGAETVFVLTEGRWLAEVLQLRRILRSEMVPIVAGLPFGIWPEILPSHIPLPSKISHEILEPVAVESGREDDEIYVKSIYDEVERRIQEGVVRLAAERRWPILG